MSNGTSEKDAVRNSQGSTFLWTEHYGTDRTRAARMAEWVEDAAFGLALVVMAAGVAGFLTLERPSGNTAASVVAHQAL